MNNTIINVITNEREEILAMLANFEAIKGNISVRLVNKDKVNSDLYRSASEYGFEDLVLVPRVEDITESEEGTASCVINKQMCEMWGVSPSEIIELGISNLDYKITSMKQMMLGMMGLEEDDPMADLLCPPTPFDMYVITNKKAFHGAASVIKAKAELEERFPDGYIILPSSIHEVIAVPTATGNNKEELLEMVTLINGDVVDEKDKLADNVYEFVA